MPRRAWSPEAWLLAFAASVFVFHQLPALLPAPAAEAVDLLTPFAVIASSAAVLAALGARGGALAAAVVAAVLYVNGHGIHLAANSIANRDPAGDLQPLVYFWDERFSHVELVLGWFGLLACFCLAEGRTDEGGEKTTSRAKLAIAAALLGFTLFTTTVEGQTWPLLLAAAPPFGLWAARARRPLLVAVAAAYALGVALLGVWALVTGGVPEFSEALI